MTMDANGLPPETKPLPLSPRFDEALVLASQLHRQQFRKGTSIPYLTHLLGVTTLVLEHGGDEDQAIAAMLHDAVEDQGGPPTLALIRDRFGPRVAGLVQALTDSLVGPGQTKPLWEDRKVAYLEHLAKAPADVLLISICDKLYNARAILADLETHGAAVWSRFKGDKAGTLWYYRRLALLFKSHGPKKLAQELEDTVAEMELTAGSLGGHCSASRTPTTAEPQNLSAEEQQDRKELLQMWEERGKPGLGPWGKLALDHIRKLLPQQAAYYRKLGVLKEHAILQAEQANAMYGTLIAQGWLPLLAREQAMRDYIYVPSEEEQEEDRRDHEELVRDAQEELAADVGEWLCLPEQARQEILERKGPDFSQGLPRKVDLKPWLHGQQPEASGNPGAPGNPENPGAPDQPPRTPTS